ncbi:FxSxx-COOH system tetratricopeptide repeat protein [Streptosporangium subroseum]|uniref:FxSxx-COOH system tetratricopeptide repeat protein n=1 Tax=Streptosporangium subroseum TaxID=106412 RepID=UPI00308B9C98|nr:FxSxx-COOH system tetratricopeptide repeat protein [Streptosporangium subroseum]
MDNRTIRLEPGTLQAPAEVDLTAALTNLPDAPAAVFIGRENALARLDHKLSGDQAQVIIGQVIHGLGGIGKTELARQYATINRDCYRLRWWITAESAEQIQDGLTALAERLHPLVALALTGEQAADWARGWLQAHKGWLLVLDNVEDPAHVRDLLGQLYTGHILITTRRTVRWPAGVQPIPLPLLDEHAAAELITKVGERDRPEDQPAVEKIAKELGCLPLALEQAGAYIRESQISPDEYLALLIAHPAHMYAASLEGGNAERTIARLWRVHLDAISKRNPYAVQLLRVLACYAPDDIPRDILDADSNRPMVLDALRLLFSYSLILLEEETVSVHRLIQAVVAAETRTVPGEEPASDLALAWLADAWMASTDQPLPDRRARRRTLSAHVESLIRHHLISTGSQEHAQIFHEAATHERSEGNYRRTHALISHALAVYRSSLGEEHLDTLTSWNNLGIALRDLGRFQEAEAGLRIVLETMRRVLGEEHPETLACRGNLAGVLGELGRLQEAEADFRTVLETMRRVLGEEHPETLASRNNLASMLRSLGRLEEAEAEHRAELEICRRVLGEEHPSTLISRNNLAGMLQALGRLEEAETEHRAVLEIRRRVLGEEHPDTLAIRGNLATVLRDLGRLQEAEIESRTALETMRRVLGEEHPATLAIRGNLATVLRDLGRLQEAEIESRTALETMRRIIGEEHLSTLASWNNLALVLRSLGRLQEAEAEFRTVLGITFRILGEEHPYTLISRNNLAGVLQALGRLEESETEHRAVLEIRYRVLGEEHPETLAGLNNLAGVLQELGRLEEAEAEFRIVLETMRQVLGEEHPHTVISRNNLVGVLRALGRLDEADALT